MDMDRYIGRLLDGRYEILEVIGTGGMAVVYKARCHRLNRLVAIKILKDEFTKDEEFRRRFHAESQAVAMLSHANIVSVYDVSTADDADYIVMELIDGITLKQYMAKKGVLNWKETLHFAIQIAKALDHAHSRGIIHRDIKPHNVMVLKNGSVKVADFGIAQVMSKSNTLTKEALGSVHYLSPEQAKGGRVDNRSDLYSLGVVMYEMMTGRPPYDGESPVAVAIQHINGKAPLPSTLNPNIPGGLEQIIMRAMAQEPDGRYSTATAMLYDMDEFRKDPTILFDYNNSSAGMDDATLIQSAAALAAQTGTTAERTAAARSGGEQPVRRRPAQTEAKKEQPGKKTRRREEIVEDEDRGGKVATIAVILCSIVAIVAIGIFLNTLLNDDSFSTGQNMITVPNLVNIPLSEALESGDYTIVVESYSFSDDYDEFLIMDQQPSMGTQIEKGGTISVIVSAGPEPSVKLMQDLVGLDEEQAINYLVNTQGVDSNLILRVYEYSTEVEEGHIIRTNPMKNENLPTDEAIYLYISNGPKSVTKTMVDLTSDFYDEESARKWLDMNGFNNYIVEYVESSKASGKVVSQSVSAGTTVDVTTYIVLLVSASDTPETPNVPSSTTKPPEDYVSKLVTIDLPEVLTEDCTISIYRDGSLVEERSLPAGTVSTQFRLDGKDTMIFEVRMSNGAYWTVEVDFSGTSSGDAGNNGSTDEGTTDEGITDDWGDEIYPGDNVDGEVGG